MFSVKLQLKFFTPINVNMIASHGLMLLTSMERLGNYRKYETVDAIVVPPGETL